MRCAHLGEVQSYKTTHTKQPPPPKISTKRRDQPIRKSRSRAIHNEKVLAASQSPQQSSALRPQAPRVRHRNKRSNVCREQNATCLSTPSTGSSNASHGRLRRLVFILSGLPDSVTYFTAHFLFSSATYTHRTTPVFYTHIQ